MAESSVYSGFTFTSSSFILYSNNMKYYKEKKNKIKKN